MRAKGVVKVCVLCNNHILLLRVLKEVFCSCALCWSFSCIVCKFDQNRYSCRWRRPWLMIQQCMNMIVSTMICSSRRHLLTADCLQNQIARFVCLIGLEWWNLHNWLLEHPKFHRKLIWQNDDCIYAYYQWREFSQYFLIRSCRFTWKTKETWSVVLWQFELLAITQHLSFTQISRSVHFVFLQSIDAVRQKCSSRVLRAWALI